MSTRTILVTGASGQVGKPLTRLLLDQGFKVNALMRNIDSEAAQDLKKHGANLVKGDFEDVASLKKASEGIWGVFINAIPTQDTLDELKHTKSIINAAKEAGAKFAIYMSVVMAGRAEDFPGWGPDFPGYYYWWNKRGTELALQEAGFEYWTIFRPGMFATNFFTKLSSYLYPRLQKEHLIVTCLEPESPYQLIDPDSIARYTAAAFADPETFNHVEVDLVTEVLTLEEFTKLVKDILGVEIKVERISREEYLARGLSPINFAFTDWAKSINYQLDFKGLNALPVARGTIADHLKRYKKEYTEHLTQ